MTGGDQQGPEEQRSEDKPFQFTDKRKVDPSAAQPHPAGEAAGATSAPDEDIVDAEIVDEDDKK